MAAAKPRDGVEMCGSGSNRSLSRRTSMIRAFAVAPIAVAACLAVTSTGPAEAASDTIDGGMVQARPPALPPHKPVAGRAQKSITNPASPFGPAVPYAPATTATTGRPDDREVPLYLVAKLTDNGKPLSTGLVWRVFGDAPGPDGHLPLVAMSAGGDGEFRLKPGTYLVHAAYGRAGLTRKVVVDREVVTETVVLRAGGLRLEAVSDDDRPLPAAECSFDIFGGEDANGERPLVLGNVKPGAIVRLPAGTYHIESRYGDINAVMRADIEVHPGKLTDARLHQKAAEVTLKLVSAPGGEALANTQWSVLTPAGDVVTEKVGAFPTVVLAEGQYDVVATNGGKTYTNTVEIESGRDRDVEVLASDMR